MNIGFTGTRKGLSQAQQDQLAFMLGLFMPRAGATPPEFHYGTHESVRLFADEQAATFAARFGYTLVSHFAMRGKELARDREQVEKIDILIAGPLTDREEVRSGTWTTVRYARKERKPIVMLSRGTGN